MEGKKELHSADELTGLARGDPWLVAAFFVALALISLVAFLFSTETKDVDIGEMDPAQREIVSTAALTEAPLVSSGAGAERLR